MRFLRREGLNLRGNKYDKKKAHFSQKNELSSCGSYPSL
ncbi:hypothetical protein JMA_13610 [Jeotgalibacillus malaysiensis]|uniref:Uncharacterized protein n=1 Tax=Jeotgalibacillus malaysiensis TaxID=1508404 RepID=A0A0B5AQ63_9BACL|nr:hypothetical protein JMA_13610 [Jeotgalibacillus malaysiensis]